MQDLKTGVLSSQWYDIVTAETDRRGLLPEILERGKEFVSNRREYGVVFAQFCFHAHSNALTGSSADLVKLSKKFGVLPFLFVCHPEQSRYLLSFLLSCWRYTDACRCINYPAICETCDQENSSVHILFECVLFCLLREEFETETGQPFSFALLESEDLDVCRLSVRLGKDLFEAVAELCEFWCAANFNGLVWSLFLIVSFVFKSHRDTVCILHFEEHVLSQTEWCRPHRCVPRLVSSRQVPAPSSQRTRVSSRLEEGENGTRTNNFSFVNNFTWFYVNVVKKRLENRAYTFFSRKMHLMAERYVIWGWWLGFSDRGSQDLSDGTNVTS